MRTWRNYQVLNTQAASRSYVDGNRSDGRWREGREKAEPERSVQRRPLRSALSAGRRTAESGPRTVGRAKPRSAMELRQLRVFQAVARTGSVAAAATQLHLTASALSHALKALETELGVRLFDRVGKGVQLTAAGEIFLAEIEPHLKGLTAAPDALKRLAKGGFTRLRLGAAASVCKHILPAVI